VARGDLIVAKAIQRRTGKTPANEVGVDHCSADCGCRNWVAAPDCMCKLCELAREVGSDTNTDHTGEAGSDLGGKP